MYPKMNIQILSIKKIKLINPKGIKFLNIISDLKLLTGEIEKLTNYPQKEKKFRIKEKLLEDRDDEKSKNELKILEQKYPWESTV